MNEGNFNVDVSGSNAWRSFVKVAVFVVYTAGALFATIMFSQSLAGLFPQDSWMRAFAYLGSWANFASVLMMLLAKDYWVQGRTMKAAAWLFWLLEFAMLVLNTLAAYQSSWASWWVPISPAAPVVVVAIWGILWYLSADHKAREAMMDFYADSQADFQSKLRRAMKSSQVQDIMAQAAQEAARQYAEKSLGVILDETHSAKRIPAPSPNGNGHKVYNQDAQQEQLQESDSSGKVEYKQNRKG